MVSHQAPTGPRGGGRQRGQALVEWLVVALALLPLFVLVPVLGRLQDQAHQVEMASRQAAFDHALRAPLAFQALQPMVGGLAFEAIEFSSPAASAFDATVRSALQLPSVGLYQAQATLSVPPVPAGLRFWAPFDQLDLQITRQTTLLVDGWGATSPQRVDAQTAGLAPGGAQAASLLQPVMQVAHPFVELSGVPDAPAFGQLERWRDLVPADRLRP